MKLLSPVDALGPAFRRTREVMAVPFRLGFFLKIALVAALTQPGFYSMIFSYPIQGAQFAAGSAMKHGHNALPASEFSGGAGAMAGGIFLASLAISLLIGVVVWVLVTYLFCRLRFTLFDLVVYRRGRVREAWSKYGSQTWRYFGVVLLVSFVFLIAAAATIGPLIIHMLGAFKTIAAAGANPNPNPWPLLEQMLPIIGVGFLLGLVWVVVDAVLQDFVLPPMAVENAPIEGAFGRFFALLREDFGSVLLYLLLRFMIALGISWVLMIVVFVALVFLGIGGLAVGFGLYHAMWQGGIGARVAFVAMAAAMALILMAVYLLAVIAVYGIAAVFKQSFAAYFFGSRYLELGNRVEPPAAEHPAEEKIEPLLPPMPPPLSEPPPVW